MDHFPSQCSLPHPTAHHPVLLIAPQCYIHMKGRFLLQLFRQFFACLHYLGPPMAESNRKNREHGQSNTDAIKASPRLMNMKEFPFTAVMGL